ncbi:hypothetical protein C8J56DRAFT_926134 [Mycena floridula]|nr:hypothetical protein C8J56DRAFT_926134 [Mycena floridula]
MSGKAPPKGPRALTGGTLPAANPTSLNGQYSPASSSASKRIGAIPPTGPRSLSNGSPSFPRGGKTKHPVNGHGRPTGPSMQVSAVFSAQHGESSSPPRTLEDPSSSSSPMTSNGLVHDAKPPANIPTNILAPGINRAAISIHMVPKPREIPVQHSALFHRNSLESDSAPSRPPEPAYEPPPPPPPSGTPPPPPPPPTTDVSVPPPPPKPSEIPPPPPPKPTESPPPPPPPAVPSPPPELPSVIEPIVPRAPSPVAGPSKSQSPKPAQFLPAPSWPPPPSAYSASKSFKVIYDPAFEKQLKDVSFTGSRKKEEYYATLMDFIRVRCSAAVAQDRIKGKGKGKESVYRYEGEVLENGKWSTQNSEDMDGRDPPPESDDQCLKEIDGIQWLREKRVVPSDPRKTGGALKPPLRAPRTEFYETKYEYDENSTGPPPATAVLITNISPLTPNHQIRRHFGAYGHLLSFEPQIDKENGSALGIVFIRFSTHEEARKCAERENGKKGLVGMGMPGKEGEELRVVLDGEGARLRAVLKELDRQKQREREEKKRVHDPRIATSKTSTPLPLTPSGPSSLRRPPAGLPPRPQSVHRSVHPLPQAPSSASPKPALSKPSSDLLSAVPMSASSRVLSAVPMAGPNYRRPPPSTFRSNQDTWKVRPTRHTDTYIPSSSSTPNHRGRSDLKSSSRSRRYSISRSPSRSPSRPIPLKELPHEQVVEQLWKSGHDHMKIDGDPRFLSRITEDDLTRFFDTFRVDKMLKSREGLFVTFEKADIAHRALVFLQSRKLNYHVVELSIHPAPSSGAPTSTWTDEALVEEAQRMIAKELRTVLQRDVSDKIVGSDLKRLVAQSKARGARETVTGVTEEPKTTDKKVYQSLSFRPKKAPKVVEEVKVVSAPAEEEEEPEEAMPERPKKKRKQEALKKAKKVVVEDEVESEDELVVEPVDTVVRKRSLDDDGGEQPVRKKQKTEVKEKSKKSKKKLVVEETVDDPVPPPVITVITPEPESALSSSSRLTSPEPEPAPLVSSELPSKLSVCDDDEDAYFARLVLERNLDTGEADQEIEPKAEGESQNPPVVSPPIPQFPRKHSTGCARTEGYYKISHAEKASYVTQYQLRSNNTSAKDPVEEQPQHVTSSRSNRANARRRAQGLEEINQVQRAVALSKGETGANELSFKFNQLQTRKKHLRFARSPIHDWGLYAMERIARGEMVIEYVGEIIRAQVAEKREKNYERQGIGSSYLFRIDEDLVVDATKKGNLGRLINHSCDPNCTAKIITINGEKKIVIYAKQDIELGDEITYDYHFPLEQDKIPCLCGSVKCRGYLN